MFAKEKKKKELYQGRISQKNLGPVVKQGNPPPQTIEKWIDIW